MHRLSAFLAVLLLLLLGVAGSGGVAGATAPRLRASLYPLATWTPDGFIGALFNVIAHQLLCGSRSRRPGWPGARSGPGRAAIQPLR
jgi:hypothetical protein